MKRYTLSVYDNTVKEPVMTVQVDELSSGHDKDGPWLRTGKVPFTQQIFNIEQKFAKDFDPGRVLAAVREDAATLTDKQKTAPPYPPEVQALRNLLPHLGWTRIDVRNNPGEEFWRNPKSRFGIRVMDPTWFDAVNLPPFLKSVFQHLSEIG